MKQRPRRQHNSSSARSSAGLRAGKNARPARSGKSPKTKDAHIPPSHSDDYYRTIAEAADDLIFIIDRDDRVLYVNASAAASQRRRPEELIGRLRHEVFPREIAEQQRSSLRFVFESGSARSFESELSTPRGPMWIHTRLIPLRDTDGSTRAILGISRDITGRKIAEQALAKSEHLYRTLVETCPDLIGLVDLDGHILMVNERGAHLYGYEQPEELIGRSVFDFVVPEDRERAEKEMSETLLTGRIRSREYAQVRKDGSTFTGEFNVSVVPGADGQPTAFISIVRDITERKRVDQQLFQAHKLQTIVTLAAGVAHDFGNILAVIMGNASVLQRRRELPRDVLNLIDDIAAAADRGAAYNQQLLAYARGGLPKPAPTDLNQTIDRVRRLLAGISPDAKLVLKLSPKLPAVMADPTQLEQVVMNLCLNGIQACTPDQHVEILTSSETLDRSGAAALALAPGDYALLQIRDNGCGMSRRTLERVFEPFFTTKPTGRGMGLPSSLGIVQSHQGQIAIESRPGEGTVASVRLPLAPPDPSSPTPRRRRGARPAR